MYDPAHAMVRRSPYLPVWVVVVVGLGVTLVLVRGMFEEARQADAARFERRVRQSVDALRERLDRYVVALRALAEFVAARREVAAAEWRFRVSALWPEQQYPGLLEVGYAELARDVRAGEEPGVGWHPRFELRESWVRAPSVFDGVESGFLEREPHVGDALAAVRSEMPVAGAPRALSAEVGGNAARGFTVYVPVRYVAEEEGKENDGGIRGVIFGSICPAIFLERLYGMAAQEVRMEVYDGVALDEAAWDGGTRVQGRAVKPGRVRVSTVEQLDVFGRTWKMVFRTTPLFELESTRQRPWLVLALGLSSTLLVGLVMGQQVRGRLRQEAVAAELAALCEDLHRVQDARERMQRDLHDGAIQSLYGLRLGLGRYERLLERDAGEAARLLSGAREAVDGLIAELRVFLTDSVDVGSRAEAVDVEEVLRRVGQRFGTSGVVGVEMVVTEAGRVRVRAGVALQLRQILQEAVSNGLRHSGAQRIRVTWDRAGEVFRCRVEDDGCGFEFGRVGEGGQGMANMRRRAEEIGGRLTLESAKGKGTLVLLEVPVQIAVEPREARA